MTSDLAPSAPDTVTSKLRFAPSVAIGVGVYVGYLAIFYTTWAVNHVDYTHIGETAESAKLHYAMPTLLGCLFLVVALSVLGWWRPVMFDRERSGPKWAWIGPVAMGLLAVTSLAMLKPENATSTLVMWSVLGGIGVGFGEEVITRGTMIVGLRTRFSEGKVWLISTLFFSALHIPNVLFGLPLAQMPSQLVLTFIFGSLLYATRRISGTLLIPIILHGLWDTSVFLPKATGAEANPALLVLYVIAIACSVAVVRVNWNKQLSPA